MRSSSKSGVRSLRRRPRDVSSLDIPRSRQAERDWFRVHRSGDDPIFFSGNANHRFSHPESPYKLLYVGVDLDTCLFERFGDEIYDGKKTMPETLWNAHCASVVRCPALHLCDLTNPRTLSSLMVDYTALMSEDLTIPQGWGLAIQTHPSNFQGMKYKSRFNGRTCVVVFDRDDIRSQVHVAELLGSLDQLEPAVDWIAGHKVQLY